MRPGGYLSLGLAITLAVSLMIKWLCCWYLYLLQIYLAKRQLSDAVAKRRSGKRNVQADSIEVIFCSFVFPITITYPYEHVICNVILLKKMKPMPNVNVLYFRTNVEFEWSTRVMGSSKSGPSQAKLQWCVGILDVLV